MDNGEGMTVLIQCDDEEFSMVLTVEMVQCAISDFVNNALKEYLDRVEWERNGRT